MKEYFLFYGVFGLKYFLNVVMLTLIFSLSCSSGKKDNMKSRHPDKSPEIGTTEILGGETIAIRGYTGDHELNSKMKQLDLEVIDCYKQFASGGSPEEIVLNLSVEIDNYGSVQFLDYRNKKKVAKKIAKCILGDIEELVFRPGNERTSNYRLVFKPVRSDKKKKSRLNSKRSRMIQALPDMATYKKCYMEALKRNPNSGGNFTISFTISQKGKAGNATILANSFRNSDVALCVVKRILKTYFPESDVKDKVQIKFKYGTAAPATKSIRDRKKSMDIDL